MAALPSSADAVDFDISQRGSALDLSAPLLNPASTKSSFVAAKESGKASWYGRAFNGRPTASGEIFDAAQLTAAHPSLPLPSLVKVTNQSNGREIVVRVNDRGPFTGGRIIDLSRRAAETLGMLEQGVATVTLDYLGPAPTKQTVQYDAPDQYAAHAATRSWPEPEGRGNQPTLYDDTLLGGVEPSLGVPDPGKSAPTPANLSNPAPASAPAPATPPTSAAPDQFASYQPQPSDLRPVQASDLAAIPEPSPSAPIQASEPMPASGPQLYVQVGSFTRINNAQDVSQRIASSFETDIEAVRINNADYFRVFAGPFATREAGELARQNLKSLGLGEGFIVSR
ncbi:septal ring lytic transglycosylase RlpA family protein [Henriciella barbarensis]|uniref:Endolytic peptidoglycan transglycosylase RlpA n=1 Tax=Henriciella barbarensis TaxID=86342 RepID=A0A399QP72_9PROT|nr:septal ring lytic transglycosylase RlpA family protein [Henriciella barbarensis]RIJ20648.1 septal ring lytic transglycosylase RlpA family protein [Henriciella barbarensis]